MNKTLATLAGAAALIAAPLALPSAALAQNHNGGGGHAGGGHAGGGFHGGGVARGGGGFHGAAYSGYRGGYRGGGGGYWRGGRWYGYGAGAALGLGLGLALTSPYYDGYYDDAYPAYGYAPPCGQWIFNPATGRYDWAAGAC